MNGNQYVVWYYNQCYGTNTCDDPYVIEGVVNLDVRCPGKYILINAPAVQKNDNEQVKKILFVLSLIYQRTIA